MDIQGFRLIDKRFVKEVNSDCLYFKHVKTGARLLKISSQDENKTFAITFKTMPDSDCGTPHIMEHSVLNGSRNFPAKSPFDLLRKGSLNTFLNAMTGSDLTIFPVASMNLKDYFNLMRVYLDAVFYPRIYQDQRIFKQEGWHYGLQTKDGPVEINGVVYNEMKGVYSSPNSLLSYGIYKNLFPDNSYRFSSGGDPDFIPSLSYQDFLSYHRHYYHPTNSYIYLYGNANLQEELSLIGGYLSDFNATDLSSEIPEQKAFGKMKEAGAFYPVEEDADLKEKTYLSLSFIVGSNRDRSLVMGLDILCDVLVNQESAPLRKALLDAKIGKELGAGLNDIEQNVFSMTVQNAEKDDKDRFLEVVRNTIKDLILKGLDAKSVEGALNRMEFQLREGDDAGKGLTYCFQSLPGWLNGGDPFLCLEYEKTLLDLRNKISSGYLESLMEKELLDSRHSLMFVLEPKPALEEQNSARAIQSLKGYRDSLSEPELLNLMKETEDLRAYQQKEDSPEDVSTIPMLELKDINPKSETYAYSENAVSGVKLIEREEFTNSVIYLNLCFDLRAIPYDLVPYTTLLTEFMGNLPTGKFSYSELEKELFINTGGFSLGLETFLKNKSDQEMMPSLVVSMKFLNKKLKQAIGLAQEIINGSVFSDKARIKELLSRHQARLEATVRQDGYSICHNRLCSYFSNEGVFAELTGGIDYYRQITDLNNNFDLKWEEIRKNLELTAELLFNRSNLIMGATGTKDDLDCLETELPEFLSKIKAKNIPLVGWTRALEKKNEAFMTTSKVQYVFQGYNFKKLGYSYDGRMRVLNKILSSDYLQQSLRVIGGAYGGFSSFSQTGRAIFASYRDPNLKETLDAFNGIPDYLRSFNLNEKEMTRYIIGTISQIDRPLTPSEKGEMVLRRYVEGTTDEFIQNERDQVLSTKASDIAAMAAMIEDILNQQALCVYGNKEKILSEGALFSSLESLI